MKKTEKKAIKVPHAPSARKTYTALYNLARPPKDTAAVINLGLDLLEWSFLPTAMRIEQFPIERGYTPSRFFKLAEINEDFAACLEIAKEQIGIRLQLLAQNRQIDKEIMLKILPLYNKTYKELVNERFTLATKALNEKQAPIAVYIDSIKKED